MVSGEISLTTSKLSTAEWIYFEIFSVGPVVAQFLQHMYHWVIEGPAQHVYP